jgi:hypothetical protein
MGYFYYPLYKSNIKLKGANQMGEEKLLLKVVSPTGCVHAVANAGLLKRYSTECNHSEAYGAGYYHNWPVTDKPITCKRCLRVLGQAPGDIRVQALEDIRDLAVGYDGFTTTKGLKSLIDVMKNIAVKALNNEQWSIHIPPGKET